MKSANSVDRFWLAWLAHLYTASGAVLAFLTMRAIIAAGYREAFLWLYAATIVDATDGWLARLLRVRPASTGAFFRLGWAQRGHSGPVAARLSGRD